MNTYTPPTCDSYTVADGVIRTDGSVKKKMSGSRLAGILGISPFTTPFQVACDLLGLGRKVTDSPSTRAGNELERPIAEYADKTWPEHGEFIHASAVFGEHSGAHDSWASDFDDEYFEGRLDGIVSKDGEDYVMEIKTTAHYEDWADGVPMYYYWQVALYNQFVTRKTKAYVVMGMLNEISLRDPSSWLPHEKNTVLFIPEFDLDKVGAKLDEFRAWYDEYIAKGVTPAYDPENPGDVELYNHLLNLGSGLGDIQSKVTRYYTLTSQIDDYDAKISDMRAEAEQLKDDIKTYMLVHELATIDGDGCFAKVSATARNGWDEAAMKKDGVNVAKYKVKTITKTFTVKKSKE